MRHQSHIADAFAVIPCLPPYHHAAYFAASAILDVNQTHPENKRKSLFSFLTKLTHTFII
jgi:hypothetical protein